MILLRKAAIIMLLAKCFDGRPRISAVTCVIGGIFSLIAFSTFAVPPSKVQVGSLGQEQTLEFEPDSATFEQLMAFHQEQLNAQPNVVLSHLNYFLFNNNELTPQQLSQLYFAFADVYEQKKEFPLAISALKNLYALANKLPIEAEFRLEKKLAGLHEKSGYFAFAVNHARQGFELAQQLSANFESADFSMLQAFLYLNVEQTESAVYWLNKAKNIVLKQGDVALKIWFLFEKNNWHYALNEQFLAQQTIKRAIAIAKEHNFQNLVLNGQLKLAELYLVQKKYLHVEPLLQTLFVDAQNKRDRSAQFLILQQVVALQLQQQNFKDAQKYWQGTEKLWRWVNVGSQEKQRLKRTLVWQQVQILLGLNEKQKALEVIQIAEAEDLSWLKTELNLLLELGLAQQSKDKLAELLAKTQAQQAHELKTLSRYNEYLYQQQILKLEQSLSKSDLAHKLKQQQLENANFKAKWLIIFTVVLLNIIGAYYIWRQYGGLFKNSNIYVDPLTQLPNYRAMCEFGYELIDRGESFSLILFDFDDFSEINKRLGFRKADSLIVQQAKRWQGLMRRDCQLSRYSGDSFVVIAPDYNQAQGYVLAERLRFELNIRAAEIQSSFIDLSASFAVIESDGSRPLQSLLINAQEALDFVKRSGKNKSTLV